MHTEEIVSYGTISEQQAPNYLGDFATTIKPIASGNMLIPIGTRCKFLSYNYHCSILIKCNHCGIETRVHRVELSALEFRIKEKKRLYSPKKQQ